MVTLYKMTNIKLDVEGRREGGTSFFVRADSERFGENEIMFQSHKLSDCVGWLKAQGYELSDITNMRDTSFTNVQEFKDALNLIYDRCNILIPHVTIEFDTVLCRQFRAGGLYSGKSKNGFLGEENGTISLRDDKDYKGDVSYINETVAHEVGHLLHDFYFHNIPFRLGNEGKSNYAKKNSNENFAVCFEDYVRNGVHSDRTAKMDVLINTIAIEPTNQTKVKNFSSFSQKKSVNLKNTDEISKTAKTVKTVKTADMNR